MAAYSDRSRNILLAIVAATAVATLSYLLWGEIKFENARRELQEFCSGIKIQDPLTQIQIQTGISPHMSLILMDTGQEGLQTGSIYTAGAPGLSCNITFMRGRLTQKNFGTGGMPGTPGSNAEKLKTW